jgi:hypothetical protein
LESGGTFTCPAYDSTGAFIAAYDSGSGLVQVLRSEDLTPVYRFRPKRRPRRLTFSPSGRFLTIEAYQGWVEDYLTGRPPSRRGRVSIDSPEAFHDDIQRVEVCDMSSPEASQELSCDAVASTEPRGGWLWARRWALVPGSRSAALLEAHFSADESEFSILCWNGVQQRWETRFWNALESLPAPRFWNSIMALSDSAFLSQNGAVTRSADGGIAAFRVREKASGSGTAYVWDRAKGTVRRVPGDCAVDSLPAQGLALGGEAVALICRDGLGRSVRVWDLAAEHEIPLRGARFGLSSGTPIVRSEGVALSPDARYLAVALLALTEALLVAPLPAPLAVSRSDLRIWSLESGQELAAIPIDELVFRADLFQGVDLAVSPDGTMLAVAGRRLRVYRFNDFARLPR